MPQNETEQSETVPTGYGAKVIAAMERFWGIRPEVLAAVAALHLNLPKEMFDEPNLDGWIEEVNRAGWLKAERKEEMAFFVSQGSSEPREPCPAGAQPAVCTAVKDLGMLTDQYGTKHKVEFRFETDAQNKKGFPFVLTRKYPVSFGSDEQPTFLRRDLESWRGAPFTAAELKKFDIEGQVNERCVLQVTHKPGHEGQIFANITAITPEPAAAKKLTKTPMPTLKPIAYDDAVDY